MPSAYILGADEARGLAVAPRRGQGAPLLLRGACRRAVLPWLPRLAGERPQGRASSGFLEVSLASKHDSESFL